MRNPDAGDAVGNGDARQATALRECGNPDAGDAVGNGDARQASAGRECVILDTGEINVIWKSGAREACSSN